MSFAIKQVSFIQKVFRTAHYTTLLKRPMTYKSAISLETIYPNSSLKLTTPSFTPDPKEKFSGYIPINKLEITYSASSGPGGQNVNKVHTKVDLRFKPSEADWLHPDIRNRLIEQHSMKISKDGYLILRSDLTRSQQLNLADCMQKLRTIIRAAAEPPREVSAETQEKIRQRHLKASRMRLATKRDESQKRSLRQPPSIHDL